MRNLKRALSLALASVMLVGMMVVGTSAASYPDVDSNDNVEAISVLQAVGVMQGDAGTGEFRPNDQVSRNEMAVIMARLLLGSDADDYVGTHPFTDVPAWADKYVAACYNEGIIMGMDDTTYGGTSTITAEQAAAMMMRALGYEKLEGTGADWAKNVVAKANSISLFKNLGGNVKAELTRNQIAQLGLNTLKATCVNSDVEQDIIVEGVVTIPGKVTYTDATTNEFDYTRTGGSIANASVPETLQLCEKLYGKDLTLASTGKDEFDRPANQWKYKNKEVATATKGADATYTDEVELGDIYEDLGQTGSSTFTYYVDGATSTSAPYNHASVTGSSDSNKIGGKGVLVEAFATGSSSNTVSVYVTNTYAGKVSTVRAATSSKEASITITPLSSGAKGGTYETTAFAKDDVVLYNYSNKSGDTGVKNVVLAEQVTGVLSGFTSAKSVTVDGTVYEFNASVKDAITVNSSMTKKEVTLTLDQNGYVLDLDAEGSEDTEYAIVLKYQDSNSFDDAKAELWFTDNTTKVVNLTANVDKQAGGNDIEKGAIVSYTVNDSDKYTLTALADPDANGSGTTSGVALTTKGSGTVAVKTATTAIGNSGAVTAANGKTIFMVESKSGDDTVYTVYTGIANVPTIKTASTTAQSTNVYVEDSATAATIVYINATDDTKITIEGSSSSSVIFVLGDDSASRYDVDKGTYYVYNAVVDGEIVEEFETATQVTTPTLYRSSGTNSKGMTTLSSSVANGTGTDAEANGSIGLAPANGSTIEWKTYAEDCEVYYVDEDDNISVYSIDSIKQDATDKVWYNTNSDSEVNFIVIQEVNSSANGLIISAVKVNATDKKGSDVSWTGTGTEADAKKATVTVTDAEKEKAITVEYTAEGTVSVTEAPTDPKTSDQASAKTEFTYKYTVTAENGDVCYYELKLDITTGV